MARPTKHYGKWRIRWKNALGKRLSATFPTRDAAIEALARRTLESGNSQSAPYAAHDDSHTFEDLCTYWIENRCDLKRSAKSDRSMIRVHLLPALGSLILRDIGARELDALRKRMKSLRPKTQHNIFTLLITLLKLAIELKWLREAPKVKKPQVRLFSSNYAFIRSKEDIHHLLATAMTADIELYDLYSTAIHTGMRLGELAGLQWEDVDLEKRLITVKHSFDGPTKSGDVRHVPILDPIHPVLLRRSHARRSKLVFPNRTGVMHQPSARVFQEAFQKIVRKSGISASAGGHRLVFHSLRHTFASHWMMAGGDIFKLQRILGHSALAMTQRYSHLAPDAFKEDFSRLGAPALHEAPFLLKAEISTARLSLQSAEIAHLDSELAESAIS